VPRRPKCRRVAYEPPITSFVPGGNGDEIEYVTLKVEEFEAIRLKDHLNLEQEEAAALMDVSRPTYQRILTEARRKIAEALIMGKAISIEGGNYCLGKGYCRRQKRRLQKHETCPAQESSIAITNSRGNIALDKIAICASGSSSSSTIDERFGRCPFFVIWDADQRNYTAVKNTGLDDAQGAGTAVTQALLNHGVGTVITRRIGPKAFAVLNQAGIKVYAAQSGDTVETALQQYLDGKLDELKQANN